MKIESVEQIQQAIRDGGDEALQTVIAALQGMDKGKEIMHRGGLGVFPFYFIDVPETYTLASKPKLRPLRPEEVPMRVREKGWDEGHWTAVLSAIPNTVLLAVEAEVTYEELLRDWETVDGEPLGVEG